ncbi:DNA-directed RNA polymerase, partial [Boothiomyces sp. JEL0866]
MLRLHRRSISILKYSSLTPIANPQVVNNPIPMQKVESAIDKNFIDELFPKSNHLVQLEQPSLPIEVLSMHKSLNYSRLMEKISAMNAAMDVGDIDQAEFIFHKVWRTNRIEMKKILDHKVFEKFIECLLALQLQDQDNLDSRPFEIRALEWYKSMDIEFQVKPGCHTFALFISYFLETGNIKAAQEKIVQMEADKFTINQLTEDPLFEEEADYMALDALLKQMGKSVTPPNSVDSLILSAIKESAENPQSEEQDESIELKATDTIGVSILRKTLLGKKDIAELDKYSQQLWLEQRAYQAAQEQFEEMQKTIPESQKAVNQLPLDLITQWHESLKDKIESEMNTLDASKEDQEYVNFLRLLTPDILARITITELMKFPGNTSNKNKESFGQIRTLDMVMAIGNSIHREYNLQQMNRKSNLRQLNLQRHIHKIHSAGKLFNMTLRKAIAKLSNDEEGKSLGWNPDWGNRNIVNVGSFLLNIAVNTIKLPIKITCPESPSGFRTDHILALRIATEWKKEKSYNMLKIHNALHDLLANSFTSVYPWSLPMLVAPLPWITLHSGGYLQHRFPLVRVVNNEEHNDYLKAAADKDHLSSVMRSLDVLGSTAWKVNEKIFKVASWFWNEGVEAPGIPLLVNLPEISIPEDVDTNLQSKKRYQAEKLKRQHKIQNAFSERCNTNYKLDIAKSFLGEKIYFPHNVDFRGRAYPLPPHLNHMGNDINRGLLMFYERKPLGESGLRWLKIHISNLFGFDKASLDERCKFTEDNLENVLDSARDPVSGRRWWLTGDKPWQLLAACFELENALSLADPTTYECGLPIHQDGSCNGLQHYAALGGDVPGAKAVNLVPSDRPGDVYSGVAKLVQEKVDQDCLADHPEALLMKTRINRKLVKQTVMTNTYGVTRIGARDQIHSRLKEARVNEDPKTALSDEQMKKCAGYITGKVFDAMKDMFEGAREIQIWLTDAAKIVTKSIPESQIAKDQLEIYNNLVKLGIIESRN